MLVTTSAPLNYRQEQVVLEVELAPEEQLIGPTDLPILGLGGPLSNLINKPALPSGLSIRFTSVYHPQLRFQRP